MASYYRCDGNVNTDGQGRISCTTDWLVIMPGESVDGSFPIGVEPSTAVGFVGAGFFLLLPLWVAMIGGRALLRAMS